MCEGVEVVLYRFRYDTARKRSIPGSGIKKAVTDDDELCLYVFMSLSFYLCISISLFHKLHLVAFETWTRRPLTFFETATRPLDEFCTWTCCPLNCPDSFDVRVFWPPQGLLNYILLTYFYLFLLFLSACLSYSLITN